MELLSKIHYEKVINHLSKVNINNLFARSVVEKHISGKVYVDNIENPKTFYVVHPYGMSLLFGVSHNKKFNNVFLDYSLNINKERDKFEWMQAYPNDWDIVLFELYKNSMISSEENREKKLKGIIELNTRINFKFNRNKYISNRNIKFPYGCEIVQTDKKIYKEMKGSVIPALFWDSDNDFIENGVGFSLLYNNKLATTAYSAFVHDDKLELGIETLPEFRGKGFARLTCFFLIDYCIENNYEPIWACSLENIGSYRLAESLGFEENKKVPYYKLCK